MDKKNITETVTNAVTNAAANAATSAATSAVSSATSLANALKLKVTLIAIAVMLALDAIGFLAWNPFNWKLNLSFGNELKIEDTANIVEKVRTISEFTTSCYYEEFVLQDSKDEVVVKEGLFRSTEETIHHEIILTVKGQVRAGFNLSKLSEKDLRISGDTIDVHLPMPEILDVISNPSDYNIFDEEGEWSHEEIVALQVDGKKRTLNNALQNSILDKANKNGKEHIENLFKVFGFKKVNVILQDI